MFRLAHISDVHLGPLPDVTYRDLASKRMVGYVNWQRNRRRHHHDGIVDAIVSDLKAQAPDHLAITGDLVNLALDGEFALARLWLETLGSSDAVSVVPGNHDAYVHGAFDKACHAWAPWMYGDGAHGPISSTSFPYLRVRQNVAIIGVSTARATAPFIASGFFREGQAERLAKLLEETGKRGLFRVIMIHHPPVRGAVGQHKRLFGIGKFQKLVKWHGTELVLHGHSHLSTLYWIDGRNGAVPVVGVAAVGQEPGSQKPAAPFNLLDISGQSGSWNVQLTRRSLSGPEMPSAQIATLDLSTAAPGWPVLVR